MSSFPEYVCRGSQNVYRIYRLISLLDSFGNCIQAHGHGNPANSSVHYFSMKMHSGTLCDNSDHSWGEGQEGVELETNGTVFLFKKDNLQFAEFIQSDIQNKRTSKYRRWLAICDDSQECVNRSRTYCLIHLYHKHVSISRMSCLFDSAE